MGLLHAVFAVSLRADQIVSGTAINFLALGITGYLYVKIYGEEGTPEDLPEIPDVELPIGWIPFLGEALEQLNLLIWVGLIAVAALSIFLFRTPQGLRLRSVGENPLAADTAGISPIRMRYYAVIASGAFAALGGVFLSIGFVHSFNENMIAGKGFIGLAAVIFGKWKPGGALAAALLFGSSSALAQRLTGVLADRRRAVPGAPVRAHADRGCRASSGARGRRPPTASPTSGTSGAAGSRLRS